ncbi:MAG: hypothetical protein NZ656_01610, partial [Nitrospinaceae bacterium]|nr:hypothetical protein [Nitrospinaceae bacterium]
YSIVKILSRKSPKKRLTAGILRYTENARKKIRNSQIFRITAPAMEESFATEIFRTGEIDQNLSRLVVGY